MRQILKLKRGGTEITRDFLSYRYKQLVKNREDLLNNIRREKKISFRQKIEIMLKRL